VYTKELMMQEPDQTDDWEDCSYDDDEDEEDDLEQTDDWEDE